jgi:hypothetical protein
VATFTQYNNIEFTPYHMLVFSQACRDSTLTDTLRQGTNTRLLLTHTLSLDLLFLDSFTDGKSLLYCCVFVEGVTVASTGFSFVNGERRQYAAHRHAP